MKKSSVLISVGFLLSIPTACASNMPTPTPTSDTDKIATIVAATLSAIPSATSMPIPTDIPALVQSTDWKSYTDNSYGLNFMFPSNWYGPDTYEMEHGIRIEVGSDIVYPYVTDRLERIYNVKNSYYIVIEYLKNSDHLSFEQIRTSQPWVDTYVSLLGLDEGESISDIRDLAIRVRKLTLGRFEGLEYIETLSDTVLTEFYYTRHIVLFDNELNVLQITGTPNNVEIPNNEYWRDAYQTVDEYNLSLFYKVLESITIE